MKIEIKGQELVSLMDETGQIDNYALRKLVVKKFKMLVGSEKGKPLCFNNRDGAKGDSSEKPDNPETDYKKPIKKKPPTKHKGKLTKPQVNWLYKEYELRISRIPETYTLTQKKEREVKIKKDIAKLLKCSYTNVNYWLKKNV